MLRARTKDSNGAEAGTFTANTRPSNIQATDLIANAAGTVSLSIGDDIPAKLFDEAKKVVAYLAAMLIELSYFPEQVSSERSAYQQYKDLYDEAIGESKKPGVLVLAVQNALGDAAVNVVGSHRAQGKFPPNKAMVW